MASLGVGEIEIFFGEEETKEVIRARCEKGVKAMREGSVTEKIFYGGVLSGLAGCPEML